MLQRPFGRFFNISPKLTFLFGPYFPKLLSYNIWFGVLGFKLISSHVCYRSCSRIRQFCVVVFPPNFLCHFHTSTLLPSANEQILRLLGSKRHQADRTSYGGRQKQQPFYSLEINVFYKWWRILYEYYFSKKGFKMG